FQFVVDIDPRQARPLVAESTPADPGAVEVDRRPRSRVSGEDRAAADVIGTRMSVPAAGKDQRRVVLLDMPQTGSDAAGQGLTVLDVERIDPHPGPFGFPGALMRDFDR